MVRASHMKYKGQGKNGPRNPKIRKERPKGKIEGKITKGDIRRLARRGGVRRISGLIYPLVKDVLRTFLTSIIRDAVIYTKHAKRNTMAALDVCLALKRRGKSLYGFDRVWIGPVIRWLIFIKLCLIALFLLFYFFPSIFSAYLVLLRFRIEIAEGGIAAAAAIALYIAIVYIL